MYLHHIITPRMICMYRTNSNMRIHIYNNLPEALGTSFAICEHVIVIDYHNSLVNLPFFWIRRGRLYLTLSECCLGLVELLMVPKQREQVNL